MYPTITREDRVREFLDASQYPTFELAWRCMTEECLELQQAAMEYKEAVNYLALLENHGENSTDAHNDADKARANLVKEMADVQYVLSQLAIFYDIDLQTAFNRVAANNMTKVQDGKVVYREDGKILKPEGYQKPDMRGL